jgi:hypothetical protein
LPAARVKIATVANDPIDTLRRTAFPNPERKGCPEAATFDALRSRRIAFDDPVWTHIEHCSPCYCEFAEIREALYKEEKKSDSRRVLRAGILVIFFVLVGAGLYLWRRGANEHQTIIAANHREAAVLNFEDGSELRSARGTAPQSSNSGVQHLPRNDLNLTVYLPLGSPAGKYELEIVSATDESVWHAEGQASIKDGLTSVPVAGDLRSVPPGEYRFRFRRPSESWHEKSVLVK